MKIDTAQLDATLKRGLLPCYLVTGDEPLIVDETMTTIRRVAQTQGYTSRERFDLMPGFDWPLLQRSLEHDSLFGDKKIVEFHLGNSAVTAPMKQLLESYHGRESVILLISCGKLTASQIKSKWYRQLDAMGGVVSIWPLRREALTNFIQQRLRQAGFRTSNEALTNIAEQSEGNLLAIRQLIEKLKLLFEPGQLTLQQIQQVLNDQPNFDVFALGESALRGESERCCKIISRLQQQGNDSTLVLWALSREIRLLLTLLHGGNIAVWKNRQALYQQCSRRVNQPLLYRLLKRAAQIDRMIKGVEPGNAWDQLLMVALQIANAKNRQAVK